MRAISLELLAEEAGVSTDLVERYAPMEKDVVSGLRATRLGK